MTAERRFKPGDCGICQGKDGQGIQWRIVRGSKVRRVPGNLGNGDLVIEIFADGEWVRPTLELLFLLVDFTYENEQELYHRPERNGTGGDFLMRYLWDAAVIGWVHAWTNVKRDKSARAALISEAYRNKMRAWKLLGHTEEGGQ